MKISAVKPSSSITFNTSEKNIAVTVQKWWKAPTQEALCGQLLGNAAFLKENQQYRQRQSALYARLYGNMSLFNFIGSNISKMDQTHGLPSDRPTFNVVQSVVDTLVARIAQSRPAPVFLTDGGDYKERNISKKLNHFILGEFFQTKAYEKSTLVLRDALVLGTGAIKIYEENNKVCLERRLGTELFIDPNEAMYGEPRQLYELKLMDRSIVEEVFGKKDIVTKAAQAYPDSSSDSSKTVSDLVMVVEGWHLPSGPDAKDGRHTIACSSGILLDEDYEKDKFPFVFLDYSPRLLGFWAQGISEQLMGTQLEINSILYTITKAIKLVGVPRVFVEDGSKVVKAHLNNEVGSIVTYRGTKPEYETAPCVAPELYAQLQRLIDYAYQQSGVSALQAASQKPAGLNSGEAIRTYDDISTDRFNTLSRRWDNYFIELAYQVIDKAVEIAKREKKYATVYPHKNGIREIDLPSLDGLKNSFVIQVFNQSALPKDPAGRLQKIAEMIQSGMVTLQEGRRLLDFPDLDQVEKLANASEERILKYLDEIVDEGKYTPPDPFMNLQLAIQLVTQYINLYSSVNLEEEKAQQLRDFFSQCLALQQAAMPPPMPAAPAPGQSPAIPPQAQPQPLPQSDLVPNAAGGVAAG